MLSDGIARNPGFASVAILSLAIGIGANTAIFSLVHTVLLRPLAYADPDRVFAVRELVFNTRGEGSIGPVNPVHAREWAKQCPLLEQVALMRATSAGVVAGGEPASIPSADVTHNLFDALRRRTNSGPQLPARRGARRQPPRRHPFGIALALPLSFGSLADRPVDPRRRRKSPGGGNSRRTDAIALHGMTNVRFEIFRPLVLPQAELLRLMGNFNYAAVVRIRRGATVKQALAEINVVQARFPARLGRKEDLKVTLVPAHELFTSSARLGLWVLAASVGAVLLIVCINLANLLLSRIASRSREAAIRTALGASRGRQFRMVLTESLLLAGSGGALGILLAGWSIDILAATTTLDIPRLEEVRLDSGVIAFAFCLALLTGLLFGALPAWRLTRNDPQEALRAGSHTVTEGRRGLRLREGLICLEVALSAALLIVTGLLTGSLSRLLQVEKGFDVEHVLTVDLRLAGNLYADEGNRERFFDRLLPKLSAIPGVQASGVVTYLPTLGYTWNDPIYLEGTPREARQQVDNRYASPGYFHAMHIAIRRAGRSKKATAAEASLCSRRRRQSSYGLGTPVLWAGLSWVKTTSQDAGRHRCGRSRRPPRRAPPTAYYPYWQRPPDSVSIVARTPGDPDRRRGHSHRTPRRGRTTTHPAIRTMEEVVDRSVAQRKFQLTLMSVFAAAHSLWRASVSTASSPIRRLDAATKSVFGWPSAPGGRNCWG